ncbi:MAG: trypsin-like peptidase domain-containing protein [Microthrixaceae bacterium]|nr:trypsin-like peptidase domain-containing protein [Microthrixaceae bacterium]
MGHTGRQLALAWLAGAVLGVSAFVIQQSSDREPVYREAPTATVLAASTERIDRTAVRDRLESSVLLTDVTACGMLRQGTTTMLRVGGEVFGMTNAHVVRGADSARLSGAGLGVGEAPVDHYLDGRDAARVDVGPLAPDATSGLEVAEAPPVGSEVYTAGFPGGSWKIQQGHVTALEQRHGWGGDGPVLVVDVPAIEGTSGGVVVDSSGRAVGLIAARDPRTGYTVAYPARDLFTRAETAPPAC